MRDGITKVDFCERMNRYLNYACGVYTIREKTMAVKTLENVTVSDAYLALMADRGVEYLFANAGTDFAPMIEALARAQALQLPHPRPVTCPHENTAQH